MSDRSLSFLRSEATIPREKYSRVWVRPNFRGGAIQIQSADGKNKVLVMGLHFRGGSIPILQNGLTIRKPANFLAAPKPD